jgi:CRISPR system Cascade subunit CasE
MTLHLVRLTARMRALAAFAVSNGASDDDGGYALHLALRRRFGEAGPQPFRLLEHRDGTASVLGYVADPAALTEAAALPSLDPLLDGLFADPPQLRAMPADWRAGQRYGFEVRVRPTVRFGKRVKAERQGSDAAKAPDGWWARAGEVDAWIAGRTRPDGDPMLTREDAYTAWLAARLGDAARTEKAEVKQFQRVRTRRSAHGAPTGRARVEGPDAVMAGTLTVADPAAFAALLARGVGRHAAFGYGMLLLSPPGR